MNRFANNNILDIRGQQKHCQLCTELHVPSTKCRFQALASRITKLLEANSMIPSILQAHKESVTIAQHFQILLKKADQAHAILEEVLKEYEYTGEEIKTKYLGRLDEWAKGNLNLDTSEQLPLFSPASSIPSENEDRPSTMTASGEASPQGS